MTAAYRLKGLGWFATCVVVVLGCYLVSLQVAVERKRLEDVNGAIITARHDLRGLETEFETRSNLAQLERWNGDVLALSAPTAQQLLPSGNALAAVDLHGDATPAAGGAQVQMAALVVPTAPAQLIPIDAVQPVQPQPAQSQTARMLPAVAVQPTAAAVAARPQAIAATAIRASVLPARVQTVAAAAPVSAAHPTRLPSREAIASVDRSLLSATTLGALKSGAMIETGRLR